MRTPNAGAAPAVLASAVTLAFVVVLAACGSSSAAKTAARQRSALAALGRLDASSSPPRVHGMPHSLASSPPPTTPPTGNTAKVLEQQLRAARTAADRLRHASDAQRAGYTLASRFAHGVGAHFVNWSLIDQPFDPARPSMLLYDGNGSQARLLAFSYWVVSRDAPVGFAGSEDHWHRHFGLCIVDGMAHGEDLVGASHCERGVYLDGRNLWMLHAWIGSGVSNPWGVFAPVDPRVT